MFLGYLKIVNFKSYRSLIQKNSTTLTQADTHTRHTYIHLYSNIHKLTQTFLIIMHYINRLKLPGIYNYKYYGLCNIVIPTICHLYIKFEYSTLLKFHHNIKIMFQLFSVCIHTTFLCIYNHLNKCLYDTYNILGWQAVLSTGYVKHKLLQNALIVYHLILTWFIQTLSGFRNG